MLSWDFGSPQLSSQDQTSARYWAVGGVQPCADICMLWVYWMSFHVDFVVERSNLPSNYYVTVTPDSDLKSFSWAILHRRRLREDWVLFRKIRGTRDHLGVQVQWTVSDHNLGVFCLSTFPIQKFEIVCIVFSKKQTMRCSNVLQKNANYGYII